MITLESDRLVFRFPEVHEEAACAIEFQRTLRIPDDERAYPLPPGLGRFPLRHIDDHAEQVPGGWLKRGGVIMPMHQSEAMWLMFWSLPEALLEYPCAIKIATGKVSAITGESWVQGLNRDPQDYLVVPDQPWLDGYCVEKGVIRQFVAVPLGEGYSAEEQITGAGEHGGLQILVYPMKAERYEALKRAQSRVHQSTICESLSAGEIGDAMGLAPGGRMSQEIYDDPLWPRGLGSAPCQSLLRDHRQFHGLVRGHGREAADQAATGCRLLCGRTALVRLLRRGRQSDQWRQGSGKTKVGQRGRPAEGRSPAPGKPIGRGDQDPESGPEEEKGATGQGS